jgi:hypothetical protein
MSCEGAVTDDEEWEVMFLVALAFEIYLAAPLFGVNG